MADTRRPRALPPVVELPAERFDEANAIFATVPFQPSVPGRDRTFAASEDGALVGLARIQRWTPQDWEIGGFWVRPDQRGRGLARALVAHVLDELLEERGDTSVWCIPFEHLTPFYASFGMELVEDLSGVPEVIRAKLDFCATRAREGVYVPTELLRVP